MSKWDEDRRTIEKLRSALKLCVEALSAVFLVNGGPRYYYCPWCQMDGEQTQEVLHMPNCPRQLALQAANEALA